MQRDRHGAKQPDRFDPARAAILDDTARFDYVPADAILAELDLPLGGTLVDFGAGTGLYAVALAQRRGDLRVIAVDEQPAMLQHVRVAVDRAAVTNVEVCDPSALPSLRRRAAGVLALNVLHELGDAALAEVRDLLAPGGTALFIDWNAEVERPVGPPRDHVYAPREAADRLRAAGFTVAGRPALRYHFVLSASVANAE